MDGAIAMVGSSCARKFRRARSSDLIRDLAKSSLAARVMGIRAKIAKAAQKVVDEWEQDEEGINEELGVGGACDRVAEAVGSVIVETLPGVDITSGGQDGDDHAFVIAYDDKSAVAVDIPANVYETGGGYHWKKIQGAVIEPGDVVVEEVDRKWIVADYAAPSRQSLLDPEMVARFRKLAYAQRGEPEDAMGQAQEALGGGVMSFVIEHVGDLTNRMAKDLAWGSAGYEYVRDKVEKSLRNLRSKYGFEREYAEQMASNAKHYGVDLKEYKRRADEALREYAEAHSKLPVYNRAQWLARQAAIDLGRQDFRSARLVLAQLEDMLVDEETWWRHATEDNPRGYPP